MPSWRQELPSAMNASESELRLYGAKKFLEKLKLFSRSCDVWENWKHSRVYLGLVPVGCNSLQFPLLFNTVSTNFYGWCPILTTFFTAGCVLWIFYLFGPPPVRGLIKVDAKLSKPWSHGFQKNVSCFGEEKTSPAVQFSFCSPL
jgi:hypothetical protein